MKYTEKQCLIKMAAYCSKAERAESDVRRKLNLWELDEETITRIVTNLKNENYLNENRFCRSFIKDKMMFNKWGKIKITYELKKKQIPTQIINTCFEDFDSSEFNETLSIILQTKLRSIKAKDEYDKRNKLIRFALGRGYSYNEVQKSLSKILNTTFDDNEYI